LKMKKRTTAKHLKMNRKHILERPAEAYN
jgi:hypothetical protein